MESSGGSLRAAYRAKYRSLPQAPVTYRKLTSRRGFESRLPSSVNCGEFRPFFEPPCGFRPPFRRCESRPQTKTDGALIQHAVRSGEIRLIRYLEVATRRGSGGIVNGPYLHQPSSHVYLCIPKLRFANRNVVCFAVSSRVIRCRRFRRRSWFRGGRFRRWGLRGRGFRGRRFRG